MFLKAIILFIVSHVMFFGAPSKETDVALPVIPAIFPAISPTSTPTIKIATTTKKELKATTTKTVIQKSVKPAAKPETKKVEKTSTTTPSTPVEPSLDFADINVFARKALVNILCSTNSGTLSPISGTGVVVGPLGLILTNAHIGQYFLLKDFQGKNSIECVARTGSPAYPKYKLELVFISPVWVTNNKSLLKEQNPKGTGENDFAFLRIKAMVDGSKLPDSFSFLPMDIREVVNVDEPVLLGSYPAGFLGGLSILQDLNITTAITKVRDIFTFDKNTIDLISVPGTVISQKGSSGGAVVDRYAHLIGIISTSSDGDTTSARDLRAITIAYINRDLQSELGISLAQFIFQNHSDFAEIFASTSAPTLTKLITDELLKN